MAGGKSRGNNPGGHISLDEVVERRAQIAEYHAEHPEMTQKQIAEALGLYPNAVGRHLAAVRAGYQARHPGAIDELRDRHTKEMEDMIALLTKDIVDTIGDPDVEQMAVASKAGVVVKFYERIHRLHGADAPKQQSLNARLLLIATQTGIPFEDLLRTSVEAVAMLKGDSA